MAAGSKRGGAGDRVLEGRHVIGLFFLMIVFSGVFFTLGYVMGRNQFEGQLRAEASGKPSDFVVNRPDVASKKAEDNPQPEVEPATDPVTPPSSDWEFYHAGESKAADEHLKPAPVNSTPGRTIAAAPAKSGSAAPSRSAVTPAQTSRGGFTVQVAALTRQTDAMNVAQNLQRKKLPAYVVTPQKGDKYYQVQVGPYPNQKEAEPDDQSIEDTGITA